MARIRVRVQPPDEDCTGYHVHLPSYMMVSGTEQYSEGKLVSVEVLVPDDECDERGQPDKEKIRMKYRGQPRWDREETLGDVV